MNSESKLNLSRSKLHNEELQSPESGFLQELFRNLNKKNIRYCVLRNYEKLPSGLGESDLDILFHPDDFENAKQTILVSARKKGGKCIAMACAFQVTSIALCGRTNDTWWGAKLDMFSYVGTNGCDIMPALEVLARACKYNGIKVAHEGDDAIIAAIKEIIGAGIICEKYHKRAIQAFKLHRDLYEKTLKSYFGNTSFEKILLPFLQGNEIDLQKARKILRRKWFLNMVSKDPIKIIKSRFVNFLLRTKRVIFPPGFCVAVIGTDGSGKSTIINRICFPLGSALHSKPLYKHLRPNLLPSIATLFGKRVHEGPVTNPHGSKPSGFLGSLARLGYYSTDYILGYWLKIYPGMARRSCLFIFDRYFHDFLIDPARSRIRLPKWMVNLFCMMIPRPDLILCLGADPLVIHARKPELPLTEVVKQVTELKRHCRKTRNAVWIDTGKAVKESIDQALDTIVDHMATRYE